MVAHGSSALVMKRSTIKLPDFFIQRYVNLSLLVLTSMI